MAIQFTWLEVFDFYDKCDTEIKSVLLPEMGRVFETLPERYQRKEIQNASPEIVEKLIPFMHPDLRKECETDVFWKKRFIQP